MSAAADARGGSLGALAWALLGAASCAAMAPLEPSLLEEGMLIHVATRLVAGERLFADVASFTGPLPFEALAALFRLFGAEIAVARAAVALLHGIACGGLFALARAAGAGALAHAVAASAAAAPVFLFPLLSIYFYSTLAGSLGLLATLAALRGARAAGFAACAGALVACVALTKQTVGVSLAATLLVALAVCAPAGRRLRVVAGYAAGGAAIALLTVGVYAVRGILTDVVDSLVWLPLSFDETFASPYVNFWPLGEFSPAVKRGQNYYVPFLYVTFHGVMLDPSRAMVVVTQLLYALPWVAPLATALARLRGGLPAAVWLHGALQVALLTHLFPRADWGHLVFVLPASVAQLVLVAAVLVPSARLRRALSAVLVTGLAAGALYWGAVLHLSAAEASWGPRIPLRPVSGAYRSAAVPRVIEVLRERAEPGEPIFVARAEPLVYFATDTTNPTPFSGVVPGGREIQERIILEALENVRFVVMSDLDQPILTYYRDQLPAVQAYLERHFRVADGFAGEETTWLVLLERGADRRATAIDLIDLAREAGRPFVRDAEGRELRPRRPLPDLATRLNRRPLLAWLGAQGGGIDFHVVLPQGGRLEADWGLGVMRGPTRRYELPDRGSWRLAVRRRGSEAFETLALLPLDAREPGAGWTTLEVDLGGFAGEAVTLRLEVEPDEAPGPRRQLFWWGSPRITAVPSR